MNETPEAVAHEVDIAAANGAREVVEFSKLQLAQAVAYRNILTSQLRDADVEVQRLTDALDDAQDRCARLAALAGVA